MSCGATFNRSPVRGQKFKETQPIRIWDMQNNSQHSGGRPSNNLSNPWVNLSSIRDGGDGWKRRKLTCDPQRIFTSNSSKWIPTIHRT